MSKIRQALHSPADAVTFDDIQDDVAAELLNLPDRQTFQTQTAAAIKMQAIFRSVSQTSKYQQARARLILVQAVYRGFAQKKKYQEAADDFHQLLSQLQKDTCPKVFEMLTTQNNPTPHALSQPHTNRRAEKGAWGTPEISCSRGVAVGAEQTFKKQQAASIKMQANFLAAPPPVGPSKDDSLWALHNWQVQMLQQDLKKKAAAIKMQAIFRSVSQTSKYQQARALLTSLQAVYRGVAQKKKYQEARARLIRLQAVYRGVAQKKKYQEARARLTSSEVKKSGTKRKLVIPELVEEAPKKGSRARKFVAPAASQEVKEPKKALLSLKSVVPAPVEEQVEAAPKPVLRSCKSGRQREPAPVEEVQEPPKKRSSSRKCVAPAVVEKPVMVGEMPARASKAEKKAVRAAPKSKSVKATAEKATALARRSARRG